MPVREVEDGMAVEPNHVYVMPPNRDMVIAQGILHLTPRAETHVPQMPVDTFLRSLAEDCGESRRRCDPVGDRHGRHAGPEGDQGSRGAHLRAGRDGPVQRHAAQRRRGRRRRCRPAAGPDRRGAAPDLPAAAGDPARGSSAPPRGSPEDKTLSSRSSGC